MEVGGEEVGEVVEEEGKEVVEEEAASLQRSTDLAQMGRDLEAELADVQSAGPLQQSNRPPSASARRLQSTHQPAARAGGAPSLLCLVGLTTAQAAPAHLQGPGVRWQGHRQAEGARQRLRAGVAERGASADQR